MQIMLDRNDVMCYNEMVDNLLGDFMIDVGQRVKSLNCGWMEAITSVSKEDNHKRKGRLSVRFDDSDKIREGVHANAFVTGNVSRPLDLREGDVLKSTYDGDFEIVKIFNRRALSVKFLNTGNMVHDVQKDAAICGYVRDRVVKGKIADQKEQERLVAKEAYDKQQSEWASIRKAENLALQQRKLERATKRRDETARKRQAAEAEAERVRKTIENARVALLTVDKPALKGNTANTLNIDFKDRDGNWVLRFSMNGEFIQTRLGKLHNNVTQRAKKDGSFQKLHNTYTGVTISDEFANPQSFCDWVVQQPGWGLGFVLEKDLLIRGNKTYCAEACVFLPAVINYAIVGKGEKSIVLETAKGWDVKFQAENKSIFLGTYASREDGVDAYKKYRKDYLEKLAISYQNLISERAYQAILGFQV